MRYKFFAALLFVLLIMAMASSLLLAQESTAEPTEASTGEPVVTEVATEAPQGESTEIVTGEPPLIVTEEVTAEILLIYIVQYGDTLSSIASRHGVTTRRLSELNNISNPQLIYVGQRLRIPATGTVPTTVTTTPAATQSVTPVYTPNFNCRNTPPNTVGYTVRAGESLYQIAVRNRTNVNAILRLNNLNNPNLIYAGQCLYLPIGSPDARPTVSSDESIAREVDFTRGIEVLLDSSQNYTALSEQARALGATWVKFTVDWEQIEPAQGNFNFANLDSAISAFDAAGLDVMLTLVGAPNWALPDATEFALSSPFYIPPQNPAQFGEFAGIVASRYQNRVSAYEIWTEPNFRTQWLNPQSAIKTITDANGNSLEQVDAGLAPARYIDLLRAAYTAIKASDNDAIVVTAGLAPIALNDSFNAIETITFLEMILQQGALEYSDAIGIHLNGFENAPDTVCCAGTNTESLFDDTYHHYFNDLLTRYRQTVLAYSPDTPLWVTQFGWGTFENSLSQPRIDLEFYVYNVDATEQSIYIAQAFSMLQRVDNMGVAVLYNLNGCAVGNRVACFYSAIDVNGAERPLFTALASLADG